VLDYAGIEPRMLGLNPWMLGSNPRMLGSNPTKGGGFKNRQIYKKIFWRFLFVSNQA